jgi:CRP/FNR family transcriptional regulator
VHLRIIARIMPFILDCAKIGLHAGRGGERQLKSSKAIEVLSSIPYFAKLDVHTLESISHAALRRTFDAGQVVFLEGEPNSGLYTVQEGWLRAVKISQAGREQVIRFVGPGEMFNEIGVFAGGLNQVTVEALEPSVVWIIRGKRY